MVKFLYVDLQLSDVQHQSLIDNKHFQDFYSVFLGIMISRATPIFSFLVCEQAWRQHQIEYHSLQVIFNIFRNIMQDLSNHSLSQLRTLEAQVVEELKKRHFLGVSQAREQILHIARGAGLSVKELLADKGPKEPKSAPREAKFSHPDDSTKQWSGLGRQPGWVKDWLAAGKSLDDAKI